MTGTPAPAIQPTAQAGAVTSASGVSSPAAALHPLLDLLRAAPFGSSRALWIDAVVRPLQARKPEVNTKP